MQCRFVKFYQKVRLGKRRGKQPEIVTFFFGSELLKLYQHKTWIYMKEERLPWQTESY